MCVPAGLFSVLLPSWDKCFIIECDNCISDSHSIQWECAGPAVKRHMPASTHLADRCACLATRFQLPYKATMQTCPYDCTTWGTSQRWHTYWHYSTVLFHCQTTLSKEQGHSHCHILSKEQWEDYDHLLWRPYPLLLRRMEEITGSDLGRMTWQQAWIEVSLWRVNGIYMFQSWGQFVYGSHFNDHAPPLIDWQQGSCYRVAVLSALTCIIRGLM